MQNLFYKSTLSIVVSALILMTNGCGGGSSDNATPATSVVHTGTAIDGVLVGSTVCIDVNKNNVCDAGEPSAITDAKGKFTIASTSATGPLLLIGGTDNSTGKAFTGSLKAPAGSTVVTPLTSAIQSLVESGKSAKEAEKNVKAALGLIGSNDVNLTTFDPYAEISGANSLKAQAVLAKQTQLQVLVHSATVTVAGADANTDVNSTMSSVFDAIVENFNGATGAVTLDATAVSAATKKAADKVYVNNQAARVAAKVVAQTSAEDSVRDADNAEGAISSGTPAEATSNLDAAISKVNTTAEVALKKAAADAKVAADANKVALDEIERLQKIQQEKEALIAIAQRAKEKAEADAIAAKVEADKILADATATAAEQKAAFEAQLAAQVAAQKAAAQKAAADAAAATAQKLAAAQEKAISAQAAQREAEAEAAEKQAEAEKLAAQARQVAAEQAVTDAKAAKDLKTAQDAATQAESDAKGAIAKAEVNANVQIANFFAAQAELDANRTQEIADLNITGTLVDANATTAHGAAAAALKAASDANITIPADNNISTAIAFKDEAQKQAQLAHQAFEDAQAIKAKAELNVAAELAIKAKIERINIFITQINNLESNATKLLNDANLTANTRLTQTNEISEIAKQFSVAQSIAQDANKTASEAKVAFDKVKKAVVDISNALGEAKAELATYNELKAELAQEKAEKAFDSLKE